MPSSRGRSNNGRTISAQPKVVQIRSKVPIQLPERNQKSEKERRSREQARTAAQTKVPA